MPWAPGSRTVCNRTENLHMNRLFGSCLDWSLSTLGGHPFPTNSSAYSFKLSLISKLYPSLEILRMKCVPMYPKNAKPLLAKMTIATDDI